ncbi:MAG TPA: type II toxin-antitoxin system RelE/ParE family toxin [Caulobacterales bacterium]|nr:type II toxin-antitoxin system RelE/ParE family toxin [Caulobacterales bacterium]
MSTIVRSRQARSDIVEIAVYYGERNPGAAKRLLDRIARVVELLAEQPLLGRRRPDLRQDLRSFPARPHVIFYLPLVDGVQIVRILHGARDIGPSLFEDE